MQIYYVCDNEGPCLMDFETLIANFIATGTDIDIGNMREDVEGRGWFKNTHDNGEFIVLNIDMLKLTLTPEAWDDPMIYPAGNQRIPGP